MKIITFVAGFTYRYEINFFRTLIASLVKEYRKYSQNIFFHF